jgi:hemerythrin
LQEIAALKRKIDENESGMAEIMETKRLLIRWLIQHIRQMDMAFVDFLKEDVSNK